MVRVNENKFKKMRDIFNVKYLNCAGFGKFMENFFFSKIYNKNSIQKNV